MANNNLELQIDSFLDIQCKKFETPELCRSVLTSNYNFKLIAFNVRSINKNFDAFLVCLHRMSVQFDVIILTECWLNETTIIDGIPGYTPHHTKNNINKNGGVVAYIKNSWNATTSELHFDEASCLAIEIPNHATILGIYRSPSFNNVSNIDLFLQSLDTTLKLFRDRKNIIMAGDLNIDILQSETRRINPTEYLCLLAEHDLIPAITIPTRLNACLDHIFIKSNSRSIGGVCNTELTDHKTVLIGFEYKKAKANISRIKPIINYEGIAKELESVDWTPVFESTDVNHAAESFTDTLTKTVVSNTKHKKVSKSKFTIQPWITPGLMRCMRHRDRLHSKLRRFPKDEVLRLTFCRYRNFCNELLKKLKISYESSQLEANSKNPKGLWNTIRNICNFQTKNTQALDLITAGNDPVDALNECNTYFATVGQNLASTIMENSGNTEEASIRKTKLNNITPNSFFMQPTDAIELDGIIRQLKQVSAPGLDGLNNQLIKSTKLLIIHPLVHIFNLSLSTGCFPDCWKVASVSPIHKSGPKTNPGNYRPISLLSNLSKLLEKLVNKRLVSFLESYGLLSDRQFGFRQRQSTEDAVTLLTNFISKYLDNGLSCVGVFLDLAKAFDTVSIPLLLKKMEIIGIRGLPLSWFTSYLSQRKQLVKVESFTSDRTQVNYGVPQGSILGPTLFIIYMNDLHDYSTSNSEIICYADDTVLLYSGKGWDSTISAAEKGVSQISEWLRNNLLTLNSGKTKYLCFHKTAASKPSTNFTFKVHSCNNILLNNCSCDQIERVHTMKYLGVSIDENLNFKDHVLGLAKRVRKIIGVMKKLRNSASKQILTQVYTAICQSLLTYCITIWGSAAKTILIDVERAQRSVLKVMLKKPYRYPTSDLYTDSQVLSVRKLFILKTCLSTHRKTLNSPEYNHLLSKRVFRIPTLSTNTTFARRFGNFISAHIYNNLLKHCDIKTNTITEAKKTITKFLLTLDYQSTEQFLI